MQVPENREVYTFCGGSCIFPMEVLKKAQGELLNWNNLGIGVMEMSHRSKEFVEINDKANEQIRKLLSVPDNYKVLFMQGGATLQYAAVPMNLLQEKNTANFIVSGYCSQRAFDESTKYCNPNLVAPIQENFSSLPLQEQWNIDKEGAYFYYTDNETVEGLEFQKIPEVGGNLLVSDMTSSLGTKEIDINKFGVVFASAQKNLGPAGVTIVIVRDDLFNKQRAYTPNMFNWKTTLDHKSVFNTTPCFAVYMTGLFAEYSNQQGGVPYFQNLAEQRSKLIYDVIDSSHGFYQGRVIKHSDRSRMNLVFSIKQGDEGLEKLFIAEAEKNGLIELQGHESTGGLRVSMYNGMPIEGAKKLKDFMQDFLSKSQP